MTNEFDRRESTPMILEKLDQLNAKMDDIKNIAIQNRDTLRGTGSEPGLVGCVHENTRAIVDLAGKSNRNDAIVGIGTIIGSVVGFIFGGPRP